MRGPSPNTCGDMLLLFSFSDMEVAEDEEIEEEEEGVEEEGEEDESVDDGVAADDFKVSFLAAEIPGNFVCWCCGCGCGCG